MGTPAANPLNQADTMQLPGHVSESDVTQHSMWTIR